MIYHYGVTQQGYYHIQKEIVCQDAHYFKLIKPNYAIAAVADGLGSASKSDIASKIAVKESVEYCENKIDLEFNKEQILAVIKESFRHSLDLINETSRQNGDEEGEYDTTLVVAIYLNGTVYYGNAGDSGIVVLNQSGDYEALTEQQRDEDGRVYPLWFGEETWVFGYKENVASVLMATDGMLETLFPFLLKYTNNPLYVALAHYLMSEDSLNFEEFGEDSVQNRMEEFISNIPGQQVNDDKTVLVMCDLDIKPERKEDEYYKSPDWESLKKKHDEEYRRLAYPHLYEKEETELEVEE